MSFKMDELIPMAPVNFFHLGANIYKLPDKSPFAIDQRQFSQYQLPDTSHLTDENGFAQVAMGWNREGIEIAIDTETTLSRVEIMIDTRDVKTSGYNTRFCHHFYFLPDAIDGVQAGEITRFRTEDTHELCDPKYLQVKTKRHAGKMLMNIYIPAGCLHGYDPDQFKRMGFTYRLMDTERELQHFSVVTGEFQIEQQPSLWASLSLQKKIDS
jgi:hypothetical protein